MKEQENVWPPPPTVEPPQPETKSKPAPQTLAEKLSIIAKGIMAIAVFFDLTFFGRADTADEKASGNDSLYAAIPIWAVAALLNSVSMYLNLRTQARAGKETFWQAVLFVFQVFLWCAFLIFLYKATLSRIAMIH